MKIELVSRVPPEAVGDVAVALLRVQALAAVFARPDVRLPDACLLYAEPGAPLFATELAMYKRQMSPAVYQRVERNALANGYVASAPRRGQLLAAIGPNPPALVAAIRSSTLPLIVARAGGTHVVGVRLVP